MKTASAFSPVHRLFSVILLAVFLALRSIAPSSGNGTPLSHRQNESPVHLAYQLSIADLAKQRLHVVISVKDAPRDRIAFAIPAWTPGYYQILHYEKAIESVQAEDESGKPLALSHSDARTWEIEPNESGALPTRLTLAYDVTAQDYGLGFFGSVLHEKERQGYVNGASALMYLVDHTKMPAALTVALPADWQLATPLLDDTTERIAPAGAREKTYRFTAPDYDTLIDSPLQMGKFDSLDFTASRTPFQCVLVGKQRVNKAHLAQALTKIASAAMDVFTAPGETTYAPPFRRYVFIFHFGGGGFYGGLEHHSATVIHLPADLEESSLTFLSIAAHEFFHAWNVKSLRPVGLGPFDYTQPVRTPSLWFAEGVTDYYAQLLLVRAGLCTPLRFWEDIADRIADTDESPARNRISLEEASLHTWEGDGESYEGLSYYRKGSLVGLYFDLRLRELTQNRKGLDDVMRALDARYGRRGAAYPDTAILKAINTVGGSDLSDDYDRYVRSTAGIAWEKVLRVAGVELRRDRTAFLGVQLTDRANDEAARAALATVVPGFAGARMGLLPGDVLLSLNGQPVDSLSFSKVVEALPVVSPLTIELERDTQLLTLKGVTDVRYSNHTVSEMPAAQTSPVARLIRKGLLTGSREARR